MLLQADVLELKANRTFALRQRPRGEARPGPRLGRYPARDPRSPCTWAIRWWPALATAPSAPCSTSTATTRTRRSFRRRRSWACNSVPAAGDEFRVFEDAREARALADERRSRPVSRAEQGQARHAREPLRRETIAEPRSELNPVVKADVRVPSRPFGTPSDKMDQSEVRINTIHSPLAPSTRPTSSWPTPPTPSSSALASVPTVRRSRRARRASGIVATSIYKCLEGTRRHPYRHASSPSEVESPRVPRPSWTPSKEPKVGIAAGFRVEEGETPRPGFRAPGARRYRGLQRQKRCPPMRHS